MTAKVMKLTTLITVLRMLLLLLLLMSSSLLGLGVDGQHTDFIPCTFDEECVSLLGVGSECINNDNANINLNTIESSIYDHQKKEYQYSPDTLGRCTNPLAQGCFYARKSGWDQKRVCNSDDPPNAAELGLCEASQFDESHHLEVRIVSADWESITMNAWLLQIILSELLRVPTTIEPGLASVSSKKNLYHPSGIFEYGTQRNVESFENSFLYGDCRLVQNKAYDNPTNSSVYDDAYEEEDLYRPCAHVIPEFWSADAPWAQQSVSRGSMEPPDSLGVLAQETLFIPKFVADQDPTLLSYIGMQGDKNRQKLADTFRRPTTWRQYCQEVSKTACQVPDEVAARPPRGMYVASEDDNKHGPEGDSYFVDGLFTGHFRNTYKNLGNGTDSPATGHLIDYGCQWISYAEQQLYHLDIALSGDGDYEEGKRGYTSSQMNQILFAANATKSPIITVWAFPDPFYQSLIGTDMELHAVTLPPVTQECLDHRRPSEQSCSGFLEERVGDPRGACESPPKALHKAVSTSLTDSINDPTIPLAAISPAYDAIRLFTMTSPIYGSWFETLMKRDALNEKKQTLMRDAICQWAVDHYETVLQRFVPHSYPRIIQDGEESSPLIVTAITFSTVSIVGVLIATVIVNNNRHQRVLRLAQLEFLRLLLAGLLLMSVGALLSAFPPTDGICSTTIWFVNIGYTIELAPLLVKVAAINRLTTASRRMQKVKIEKRSLFLSVAAITSLITMFLIVWTVVDAPKQQAELTLSSTFTALNETIVYRSYYCSSESDVWLYVAFGWTFILLISSTVLAIQMRSVRQEFNESQTLGIMTYSHFVFAILRLMTFFLADGSQGETEAARYRSILVSVDAIATLIIYFLPKFQVLRRPSSFSNATFETPESSSQSSQDSVLGEKSDDRESSFRVVSSPASTSVRFALPLGSAAGSPSPQMSETDVDRPKEMEPPVEIQIESSESVDERIEEQIGE